MKNDPRSCDRNFYNCVKKPEKNSGLQPIIIAVAGLLLALCCCNLCFSSFDFCL